MTSQASTVFEECHGIVFRRFVSTWRRYRRRSGKYVGVRSFGAAIGCSEVSPNDLYVLIGNRCAVDVLHLAGFTGPLGEAHARRLEINVIGRVAGRTFLLSQWIARQR